MLLSKLIRSVWMVIKTCYSTLSKESYAIIKTEINQTESRTQIPVKLMFNNWLILQWNTRNILRSKLFFLNTVQTVLKMSIKLTPLSKIGRPVVVRNETSCNQLSDNKTKVKLNWNDDGQIEQQTRSQRGYSVLTP